MEWIFEWIKSFAVPLINCHWKLEDNMNELREEVDRLKSRKRDRESETEVEFCRGKRVKIEAVNWLNDVEEVLNVVTTIEEKFPPVSFFSRVLLGSSICQSIEKVKEIYQRGNFLDGVAIDGPPATGLTLPTTKLEGEVHEKELIWKYLMGDEVGIIGVCGMGGIGKTTIMKYINNRLLNESKKFDYVIWVTVSKDLSIFKLQEVIANFLKQYDIPKHELQQRAATLNHILERKKYVLILDDVWEPFSLLDVGIPEPTLDVGRKIVLTSRSIEVCKSMGCELVKVQPLSKEESMKLFLDHVGHNVVQRQNMKGIVNNLVEECGGLPLSIVTIAGSMKGVHDICEWRNALTELEKRVKSVKGSNREIFKQLEFSYDRLEDQTIQKCFSYCSLFPEDFVIRKDELIESWIDDGLLDGLETRQAMHDRGYSILNKLENNCLLERATTFFNEEGVKIHDVLRDMALIHIKGHDFMVKAGTQLEDVPDEQEWTRSVKRVSLMENKISYIPPHISPKCPHLTTLILRECRLRSISESFFIHMPELKVLDLAGNNQIENLPKSISHLKNLSALILFECWKLKHVPSLAKLKALRKLVLGRTAIEEVPCGIEMLENLRYLHLGSRNLKELPLGIFPHIQCLILEEGYVMSEEVCKLRKLEHVACSFCDVQEFKKYVEFIQGKWPTCFYLQVGKYYTQRRPVLVQPNFKINLKTVTFMNCEMDRFDDELVPSNLHHLKIEKCDDFKCLINVPLFRKVTDLKRCDITGCSGMECVVDVSSSSGKALQKIEHLYLFFLKNLREVVRVGVGVELESISHAPSPPAFFSSLRRFDMNLCSMVKKLFPVELLQGLQNLEKINVRDCKEMEVIIASEENHKGGTTFILPKLKSLKLDGLPKLKSICGGGVEILAYSLQELVIIFCKELKRIPLSLPLDENGQPSPPPLKHFVVSPREWWESVEWDQPHAKHLLSPFVKYSGY